MLLCATLHVGSAAAAPEPDRPFACTMVTSNFERQTVQLLELSKDALKFRDASGTEASISLAQILWLERTASAAPASAASDDFVLFLRDGQRLIGSATAMAGDAVDWKSPSLGVGTRRIDLKNIDRIVSARDVAASSVPAAVALSAASSPPQDALLLANGDVVAGVISAIDAKTVTVQGGDGQKIPVDWTNIRSIRLAPAGNPTPATGTFRLVLRDGSSLRCATLKAGRDDDSVSFSAAGVEGDAKLADVVAIEHLASSTRLLTALPPTTATYQPYFPRIAPPTGGQAAGADEPSGGVNIGGLRTRSSLPMRPRSAWTWSLDGSGATLFRTRYGIPAGFPLANATVRIRLDDKVVHEKQGLRSDQLSEPIELPLGSAKSITLEVDFGESFDVQDHVYWIEPALMQKR